MTKNNILNNGLALLCVPELSKTDSAEWNEAFAEFIAADVLQIADQKFGEFMIANYDHMAVSRALIPREIEADHHRRTAYMAQMSAADRVTFDNSFARVTAAEEKREDLFLERMFDAAAKLCGVPAPTLQAALFKIALAEREDLINDPRMDRFGSPMDILQANIDRLKPAPVCNETEAA